MILVKRTPILTVTATATNIICWTKMLVGAAGPRG